MATILETEYILDERRTANWTITQEKTISTEYPFSTQNEPLDQFVARTYLQFLWLPESIMPLRLLIPSLRRVNAPSTSSDASVHPLHALLEPLLLTTTTVTNKYHTELPQILAEGGGAGEMEETMMWYSLTHEKGDDSATSASEHSDGPWTDDRWRQGYMERMERREVQIQILLLLYKLSLPGPALPQKKKIKRSKKNDEPIMTTEDHLEAFMDRLSMWQLLGNLERTENAPNAGEECDWIQAFTEETIEPVFKTQLPELCSLLRSKVFPSSPFSDNESNGSTTRNSPPESKRSLSRAPSISQMPSPTLSTSSRATTKSKLARARSRSLSVSLAQEQKERERASNIPSRKPVFNREVSMSRVFKPKPKPKQPEASKAIKTEPILPPPKPPADLGVTLVEETPVKARVASIAAFPSTFGRQPSFMAAIKSSSSLKLPLVPESPGVDDDGEEEWMMDSSPPDVVFLNPKRGPNGTVEMDSDEDQQHLATPTTIEAMFAMLPDCTRPSTEEYLIMFNRPPLPSSHNDHYLLLLTYQYTSPSPNVYLAKQDEQILRNSGRLPEGIICTGYDADSGRRHYVDVNDGSTWVGAPYVRYGVLTKVGGPKKSSTSKKGRPRRRKGRKGGGGGDDGLSDHEGHPNEAKENSDLLLPEAPENYNNSQSDNEKTGPVLGNSSTTESTITTTTGTIVPDDEPIRRSSADSFDTHVASTSECSSTVRSSLDSHAAMHKDSDVDSTDDDQETISIPDQSEVVSDDRAMQLRVDQATNNVAKRRPMLRQITRLIVAGKREVDRFRNGLAAETEAN